MDFRPIIGCSCDRIVLHVCRLDCDLVSKPHRSALSGANRIRWADVLGRQVKRESTATPRNATQLDVSTQKPGQLAADGEPESSATVFAAGARVGLLKRLKNNLVFFERNTDAGVRYL